VSVAELEARNIDISVVIPTFNHGHFLEDCLASVLSQRDAVIEIIVVDDGSTDDTPSVARRYEGQIKYVRKENAGLSAARNTGLEHCSGKYIQFLDADDLLAPHCLSEKLNTIKSQGERSILVCSTSLFSTVSKAGRAETTGIWKIYSSDLETHLCRLNVAPPHAYFIPRDLVIEIGGFDESYTGCEDYDFWLRALGANFCFRYCSSATVYYRKHEGSMGSNKAKVGAFPFDVLVHQKKHNGSYGQGVSRSLESLTGTLALSEGALCTANLISQDVNPEGCNELVSIVCERLSAALSMMQKSGRIFSIADRLYINRLLLLRHRSKQFGCDLLDELLQTLAQQQFSVAGIFSDVYKAIPFHVYERQALVSSSFKAAAGAALQR